MFGTHNKSELIGSEKAYPGVVDWDCPALSDGKEIHQFRDEVIESLYEAVVGHDHSTGNIVDSIFSNHEDSNSVFHINFIDVSSGCVSEAYVSDNVCSLITGNASGDDMVLKRFKCDSSTLTGLLRRKVDSGSSVGMTPDPVMLEFALSAPEDGGRVFRFMNREFSSVDDFKDSFMVSCLNDDGM